jgi:hypothetical protein
LECLPLFRDDKFLTKVARETESPCAFAMSKNAPERCAKRKAGNLPDGTENMMLIKLHQNANISLPIAATLSN